MNIENEENYRQHDLGCVLCAGSNSYLLKWRDEQQP